MFSDFGQYATRVRRPLDAAFAEKIEQLVGDSAPFGFSGDPGVLTDGKKIRGALLCLVSETFGSDLGEAVPRAVAVELIQTATLIHDDYVDQHRFRRSRPAVWTEQGARKAVLLGDVVFASAIRMMSELGRLDCLIVSRAIAEVSLGAYQEPLTPQLLLAALESGRVAGSLYEKIIHLKTAVLFGAACELGAVAAGVEKRIQTLLCNYGFKIGEAYQIADDLHEVEKGLQGGYLDADALTDLAAALIHFVPAMKPHIAAGLREGALGLCGEPQALLAEAAALMRLEREGRLRSAVAWVEKDLPTNILNRLVLSAPRDLIAMFDAQRPPLCAQ